MPKYLTLYIKKKRELTKRTSEVMVVGKTSDADVTIATHMKACEVYMSHLLHQLKISYVFTSQDEHNASFYENTKSSKIPLNCRGRLRFCKLTNNF